MWAADRSAAVFEFTFANGALQPGAHLPRRAEGAAQHRDFIGDVAFSPDGRLIYAADLYHDQHRR